MTNTIDYKKRETVNVRVDIDSFEFDIQNQEPEQVILQWGADDAYPERRDIGKLCYLDRLTGKRNAHVNLMSICKTRKLAIKKFLIAAVNMSSEHANYARKFIDFIDQEFGERCNLFIEEDLKKAYIAYTRHLQHLLQLSKVDVSNKRIGSKLASRRQHGAIKIILVFLEHSSVEMIKPWAPIISRKDECNGLPIIRNNNEHYSRMFAIHLRLFEQVTNFIINKKKLPLILNMHGLKLPYNRLYIWAGGTSSESIYVKTDWRHWGLKNDSLPDWTHINELARKQGIILCNKQIIHYYQFKSTLKNSKYRPTQAHIRNLINRTIDSFCYGLVGDSGCNWSTLAHIDFDNITFIKELDKTRLISIKPRAGNKTQHIEINARFKPFFSKYLKLRRWMGIEERYGIFRYGNAGKLKRTAIRSISKDAREYIEYLLRSKTPWVNARDWRWNVSYEYLDASDGDIRMVSRVLGTENTTTRKHYGFADFESSAAELSTFYSELSNFAHRRVRTSQEIIPVKLNDGSARTLTGGCEGKSNQSAILVNGFTKDAPQPTCGTPVTCFMCENYALHADEIDFRKILSVKYWLENIGRSVAINNDEFLGKYQPIIGRIEEILAQALMLSPEIKILITSISQQVDAGQYDPYWQVQIDTLIDGGFL